MFLVQIEEISLLNVDPVAHVEWEWKGLPTNRDMLARHAVGSSWQWFPCGGGLERSMLLPGRARREETGLARRVGRGSKGFAPLRRQLHFIGGKDYAVPGVHCAQSHRRPTRGTASTNNHLIPLGRREQPPIGTQGLLIISIDPIDPMFRVCEPAFALGWLLQIGRLCIETVKDYAPHWGETRVYFRPSLLAPTFDSADP